MLETTDFLVRQHMAYLNTLKIPSDELKKFPTLCDHMFYYLTEKLGMSAEAAQAVVDDFESDFMKA